ncbi:hypothetical protein [Aeromonas finlandensis]|uniref:hypothetical protein n=1 Tax=Aeromonas finlandensis TaxID=1543375 RepID=UPI00051C8841|nr:hypothetical protein [Aeromonas finlandensis]
MIEVLLLAVAWQFEAPVFDSEFASQGYVDRGAYLAPATREQVVDSLNKSQVDESFPLQFRKASRYQGDDPLSRYLNERDADHWQLEVGGQ